MPKGRYLHLLKEAFPGAWAACWIGSTIATIVCGLVVFFGAIEDKTVAFLVAVVPLAIFAALMVGGPLRAACRIIRDQERELAVIAADRTSKDQKSEAIAAKIATLHAVVRDLMDQRDKRPNYPRWPEETDACIAMCRQKVGDAIGEGQAASAFAQRRLIDPHRQNYGRQHLSNAAIKAIH